MLVELSDLEYGALLVEIELNSGDLLLFLRCEILSERGRQRDGALRDRGVCCHAPSQSGIPTDL